MEKKLGERLQEVKNDLEEIVNKIKKDDYNDFLMDKIRVQSFLRSWTTAQNENNKIRNAALDIYLELAQMEWRKAICKINFCTSIERFIRIVNEELPKEEKIDRLEEKLLKAEISFPNYDFYSEENIQEMIHDNARAIARLLVTSNK